MARASKRRRPGQRTSKTKIPVFKALPYPKAAVTPRKRNTTPLVRNRGQALLHLQALVAAFEEVEEFDQLRRSNRPVPALWLDRTDYRGDVKALLVELRQLRELLRKGPPMGNAAKKTISVVTVATTKFIDGYADAFGKGAAALTIGAAGALLFHFGVGTDVLGPIWARLGLGK
jgi:hypothetical protein